MTSFIRTARKAGITNLLQMQIACELLEREESTFLALSHSLPAKLEAVAYAVALLNGANVTTARVCREEVGFSIVRLTPNARKQLRQTNHLPA
jgi:hypothetical protein